MNRQMEGLDSRDKGQIPVSMGTALALEAALGIYPERPETPPPIERTKEVWLNVRTLIRNIYNSLSTEFRDQVITVSLHLAIIEELAIIESALSRGSNGMVRVVYFVPDYSSLHRRFPKAFLRQPKTDRQVAYQMLENKTCKLLHDEPPSHDLREFGFEIKGTHPESFLITHFPVDLLSRHNFRKLELLESHSGGIKAYPQWHTKLTGGKELSHIPFNRFTLQVFGDNGNQFAPYPIGIRKQVLELASQDGWTSVTTDDKMRYSLKKIVHAFDRTQLLALL